MPTALILADNTGLTTNAYALTINPIQPRGLVKNQPVIPFATLEGAGAVMAPKQWFPNITFTWPDIVNSNTDHAALIAAFEARQYVKSGIEYYIGALVDPGNGWIFPTTWGAGVGEKKYIKIRILNVMSAEQPKDNDLDEILFDLTVNALWTDA